MERYLLFLLHLFCCSFGVVGLQSVNQNATETSYSSESSTLPQTTNFHKYQPIRIKSIFIPSYEIKNENQERLMAVVQKAISRVQSIFSVQRGNGSLLLKRTPCPVVWKPGSGPNAGRCAKVRASFRNEYCLHDYKIPDDHLEGLAVYNRTHPEPERVYFPDGKGIPEADFILYISAITTSNCSARGSTVGAYVTHCKQDDTGRPTAGQMNFCPQHFQGDSFNEKVTYMVCLHELFHALGFSSYLFDKFQDCSGAESACRKGAWCLPSTACHHVCP